MISLCNSRLPDFTLSQKNKCSSVSLYFCLSSSLSLSFFLWISQSFYAWLSVSLSASASPYICPSLFHYTSTVLSFFFFLSVSLSRLSVFSVSTYYITVNSYICLCLYAASILCLSHRYGKKIYCLRFFMCPLLVPHFKPF